MSFFRSNCVFRLCHIYVCMFHLPHITRCAPRFLTIMLLLTFGDSRQVSRQGPSAHQEREAGTRTRVSGSRADLLSLEDVGPSVLGGVMFTYTEVTWVRCQLCMSCVGPSSDIHIEWRP